MAMGTATGTGTTTDRRRSPHAPRPGPLREPGRPFAYGDRVARLSRAVPENAPGDLFVDDACIACDTCRALDASTFGGGEDDHAYVARQPEGDARERALLAVIACPVAAIGSRSKAGLREAA